jgi:3-phenylpropionate/trans-cinnamate dioxygenase ferredoxin reductase subunit
MPTDQTFAIVGAGLAGAKAAETLREEGFDGRVVLLGAEPERPYERPPLSKDYLRGESERAAAYVHEEAFCAEHEIELRVGERVTGLDGGRSELELDGGERLSYDRLLLSTGAEPRRLSIPGADLDGAHLLRTFADSDAIRARLDAGGRLVVIGAGWIGSEVAASARQRGMDVTVIAPEAVPLERVLGPEVGASYLDLHRDHGVEMRMEAGVASFEGDGRVERVHTADGATIDCAAVVLGVGAAPRTELAEAAGLAVEDGVLVDGPAAGRALGQRAAPGPGGGSQHARLRRALRPHPVLLL